MHANPDTFLLTVGLSLLAQWPCRCRQPHLKAQRISIRCRLLHRSTIHNRRPHIARPAANPARCSGRTVRTIRSRLRSIRPAASSVASEVLSYTNHSPDELDVLWLQLDQNRYRKDARGAFTDELSHRIHRRLHHRLGASGRTPTASAESGLAGFRHAHAGALPDATEGAATASCACISAGATPYPASSAAAPT
jgi:hypothetical protein